MFPPFIIGLINEIWVANPVDIFMDGYLYFITGLVDVNQTHVYDSFLSRKPRLYSRLGCLFRISIPLSNYICLTSPAVANHDKPLLNLSFRFYFLDTSLLYVSTFCTLWSFHVNPNRWSLFIRDFSPLLHPSILSHLSALPYFTPVSSFHLFHS